MEDFYRNFPDNVQDVSEAHSSQLNVLLTEAFAKALKQADFTDVRVLVIMSRQSSWRKELSKYFDLFQPFFEDTVWSSNHAISSEDMGACLRLLANLCNENVLMQKSCAGQGHLQCVEKFLEDKAQFPLAIGLLNNICELEEPVIPISEFLKLQFHVTISKKLFKSAYLTAEDALYSVALDFLELLADVDVEIKCKESDRKLSCLAFEYTLAGLASQLKNVEAVNVEAVQLSQIISMWGSIEAVLQHCNESTLPLLMSAFECLVNYPSQDVESDSMESVLHDFQRIIGDLSYSYDVDLQEHGEALEQAYQWAKNTKSTKDTPLIPTAYMILGNLINNNDLALDAVQTQKLHEPAASILADSSWGSSETRYYIATTVGNLCIVESNKNAIIQTRIVQDLFFNENTADCALAIHIVRKLVSKAEAQDFVQSLSTPASSSPEVKDSSTLTIDDLKTVLPPQEQLTKELHTLQRGPYTPLQITIDMARITASLLRANCPPSFLDNELLRSLINLIRLGYRLQTPPDVSEGLFALALALERHPESAPVALQDLKADGFRVLSAAIKMGMVTPMREAGDADASISPTAMYDARNAMLTLARLEPCASESGDGTALVEIRALMSLWTQGSQHLTDSSVES